MSAGASQIPCDCNTDLNHHQAVGRDGCLHVQYTARKRSWKAAELGISMFHGVPVGLFAFPYGAVRDFFWARFFVNMSIVWALRDAPLELNCGAF